MVKPPSPFLGLATFGPEQAGAFFGRDDEVARMEDVLVSSPWSVLFAASGVGKSSFLRAKLIPYLEPEYIVRYIPSWSSTPGSTPGQILGGQLQISELPSREIKYSEPADDEVPPDEAAHQSQSEKTIQRFGRVVLILDQFEELFQQYASGPVQREIAEAVERFRRENPFVSLRVLISIRGEFLDQLSDIIDYIPGRPDLFRSSLRLVRLQRNTATTVIRKTVLKATEGVPDGEAIKIDEAKLIELVEDLCVLAGRAPSSLRGVFDPRADLVEPPALQIVCKQLWDDPEWDPNTKFLSRYKVPVLSEDRNQAAIRDADYILKTFCDSVLPRPGSDEGEILSKVFDHLVGAQSAKRSRTLQKLAELTPYSTTELKPVLLRLCGRETMILRPPKEEPVGGGWTVELYHDMYAQYLTAWKTEHDQRRRDQEAKARREGEELRREAEESRKREETLRREQELRDRRRVLWFKYGFQMLLVVALFLYFFLPYNSSRRHFETAITRLDQEREAIPYSDVLNDYRTIKGFLPSGAGELLSRYTNKAAGQQSLGGDLEAAVLVRIRGIMDGLSNRPEQESAIQSLLASEYGRLQTTYDLPPNSRSAKYAAEIGQGKYKGGLVAGLDGGSRVIWGPGLLRPKNDLVGSFDQSGLNAGSITDILAIDQDGRYISALTSPRTSGPLGSPVTKTWGLFDADNLQPIGTQDIKQPIGTQNIPARGGPGCSPEDLPPQLSKSAFSPNARYAALLDNSQLRIWRLEGNSLSHPERTSGETMPCVRDFAFSQDSSKIAIAFAVQSTAVKEYELGEALKLVKDYNPSEIQQDVPPGPPGASFGYLKYVGQQLVMSTPDFALPPVSGKSSHADVPSVQFPALDPGGGVRLSALKPRFDSMPLLTSLSGPKSWWLIQTTPPVRVLTIGGDAGLQIRKWNLPDKLEPLHRSRVLAVSPLGVSLEADERGEIALMKDGHKLPFAKGKTDPVWARFSNDGTGLVTWSDNSLTLWRVSESAVSRPDTRAVKENPWPYFLDGNRLAYHSGSDCVVVLPARPDLSFPGCNKLAAAGDKIAVLNGAGKGAATVKVFGDKGVALSFPVANTLYLAMSRKLLAAWGDNDIFLLTEDGNAHRRQFDRRLAQVVAGPGKGHLSLLTGDKLEIWSTKDFGNEKNSPEFSAVCKLTRAVVSNTGDSVLIWGGGWYHRLRWDEVHSEPEIRSRVYWPANPEDVIATTDDSREDLKAAHVLLQLQLPRDYIYGRTLWHLQNVDFTYSDVNKGPKLNDKALQDLKQRIGSAAPPR